ASAATATSTTDAAAPDIFSRFAPVAVGLPSDVLLRRPDIRAAEQQLIAANANIGAARAAFFPRIALTGMYGRASSELDDLFGGAAVRTWSFLPQISLPIFDWGRNMANLDASQAGRDIAVAQYEKAIQSAFREVADALAGKATLSEQIAAQQAQTRAEQQRYQLADLRYRNGIDSHLNLLDAQRALFGSEQALIQTRLMERLNQVELYKTLGGGWTQPAPAPAAMDNANTAAAQ
ncbi:MAG: TolC family protein, partial [Brachymonas sp.]|nr:TolC family protein [Brachymonas sp.]MBP8597411.1 TolC family protein [Brachymonas sp.]